MSIKFGPAGNCNLFYEQGYKRTEQIPEFLHSLGLNAYEIQCGRGVRMGDEAAARLKRGATRYDITLSIHAPYYISMSGIDPLKRSGSIEYILQSAQLAVKTGASRIVFHTGSCAKISRDDAMTLAVKTLEGAIAAMDESGFGDVALCPETMGKINQLGTLEEVINLCKIDERLIPAIDFGHLNARSGGQLKGEREYALILDALENELGYDRTKLFHSHFSKIEYSKGGEKRHLTFEDSEYGPEFEPLAELIYKRGYTPTFICESANTMARDALEMKRMYMEAIK